ncbi:hypothetical protein FDG2_1688 [Candidatus Protofrankia californiensis]|uniref:Uncharacterized protein n=1 Tax=Candidatus Protofrankia californiensis TaxID=1839754 RepID=A0A1C3NW75_9ACTN|nr:hypothetical protein FDG2_1688 [Candidatus Protofrankia californiensis]
MTTRFDMFDLSEDEQGLILRLKLVGGGPAWDRDDISDVIDLERKYGPVMALSLSQGGILPLRGTHGQPVDAETALAVRLLARTPFAEWDSDALEYMMAMRENYPDLAALVLHEAGA